MKSAYELAMEKLEQQAPTTRLTEEQKAQIAEIDSIYKAKAAEKEVFLRGEIEKNRAAGSAGEVEALERQLSSELRRLERECEEKKEKIRNSASS